MICITLFMDIVVVFLIFIDLFIACFEETLMWYLICFGIFLSLMRDRFIWMVNEIFHAISERKEIGF